MEVLFPVCYGLIGLFCAYMYLRMWASNARVDTVDIFMVGVFSITMWPVISVIVGLCYLCSFLCDHFNGVK